MKIQAEKVEEQIKEKLHFSSDIKSRAVKFFNCNVVIMYIADITDNELLNDTVIYPITSYNKRVTGDKYAALRDKVLSSIEMNELELDEAIDKLLHGHTLVLMDGAPKILTADMEKITVRAIAEPPNNLVIKGPREGFNESLKYNLALIRRRVKSDDLVVQNLELGKLTKTQISVLYFNSVADKKIVSEIVNKLKKIDIDGVIDSHYLISYLQKNPHSLFKQIGDTEKPDILLGKMLEGRVGILVDGTPIALTLPFIIIEDLQNSDDYYGQPIHVALVRILRLVGVIIAVLLPGVYIALEIYHYKIIPLSFLVTIMNTTQGIPFSPFVEVVFVILLFEILYEANLRMPQYLGMATSIVGALILGETAVNAGLVSPPTVMIVALSGITFYIIPSQAGQFSVLRALACLVGACLGIYGILLFCVYILAYLSSFDSYNSAYLSPGAPYIASDQKDFMMRATIDEMTNRPRGIANNRNNLRRRGK